MRAAAGTASDRPGGGWFAAAGPESQSFRDISRGGPPVDASPVEWKGSGPSLALGYERRDVRRFHRFSADIAAARSFWEAARVQGAQVGSPHQVALAASHLARVATPSAV